MKFFTNEENKNIKFSACIRKIYGIGKVVGQFESVKLIGFPLKRVFNLAIRRVAFDSLKKIDKLFDDREIQSRLITKLDGFRSTLVGIKSYRGLRYINGLPVNGQRTQTNARTCKRRRFKKSLHFDGGVVGTVNLLKKKFTKKSSFKFKKFDKKAKSIKKYSKRKK